LHNKYKIPQYFKKKKQNEMKFSSFSGIIDGKDPLSPFEVYKTYNTTQFSDFNAKGVFKT